MSRSRGIRPCWRIGRIGHRVDIHLDGRKLEIRDGDDLIKTTLRTSDKEVRKKHGERRAS